jgi:hypothetical protein
MGEGEGPAPRRVQDLVLNLTWFRVGVDKTNTFSPSPSSPPTEGRGDFSENVYQL